MIQTPESPQLDELCAKLSQLSSQTRGPTDWVDRQLELCAQYGVFKWFLPAEIDGIQIGGFGWNGKQVIEGYLKLSSACLTTTFVITQRTGACKRILNSGKRELIERFLPALANGDSFSTVGISHLTTSRRHMKTPVLKATPTDHGFLLDGFSPWVTGSPFAKTIVTGATLENGQQILLVAPTDRPGVEVPPTPELVSLSASRTGEVRFDNVEFESELLLAGPVENVMLQGTGANTGGLQTSTLAVGLADAAIQFVEEQSSKREDLIGAAESIRAQWQEIKSDLLQLAAGNEVCSSESIRKRSNDIALSSSQLAMTVAKGTGFLDSHPAGRWCREALFFLVWSCPQPVFAAHLCDLAGIEN